MSFERDKEEDFLIIDSREFEISVDFDSIQAFKLDSDQRIQIAYFLPEHDGGSFQKRTEVFETCETQDLIAAYEAIKKEREARDPLPKATQSFTGPAQFAKTKSPPKKKMTLF